jgi:hypothetical protein
VSVPDPVTWIGCPNKRLPLPLSGVLRTVVCPRFVWVPAGVVVVMGVVVVVDCAEQAEVVAVIDDLDDRFPAASNACTANVYEVPHVRPDIAYEVEGVFPSDVPLRYTV